jgi:hypothetical protein
MAFRFLRLAPISTGSWFEISPLKRRLTPSTGRRMTPAARRCGGGSTQGLKTVWRLILRRVKSQP